ncbi:MAG: hypothetical protein ABUS76_00740 [Candidatus Shikimatogenerans sp. Ttur]|uniref:Small ribosomal subunit protein uS7 domain-containing protein n=1 Tax=Candidatus Shikimatogenerans sp. Ttur TaxID=3158569 RepID=A0AAU7ZXG5_9FLAO
MRYKKFNSLFNVDYKFNNKIFAFFIKKMIKNGKKILAQKIFYKSLKKICKIYNFFKKKQIINFIKKIVKLVVLKYEIKKKKIGNTIINIPFLIKNKNKRYKLGINLILYFSKKNKLNGFSKKLVEELINTYKKKSLSYKKKMEIYKQIKINKSFIKK